MNWLLFVHHVNFVLKSARAQSDLRDANRTADLMSKVKSRLVGTLVTEFQSPLRSAFSVATLLRQEADGPIESPLYRSLIADLYRAVAQLNGTHIKMLNFGRNLAEGISLDEAVLDPVEVVEAAVEAAREKARRRQIDIRLSFSQPPDIQLQADRVLIGQVLGAVLGNSVQFSRRASTIDVEMRLTNARDLAILVRDTSSGLTQANIDDLLGVSAAGAVATPESADHGSGLKLARVLTEAHQGQLSVELTEDEGAVIQIRLPKTRLRGLAPAEDIGARRAVSTAPGAMRGSW